MVVNFGERQWVNMECSDGMSWWDVLMGWACILNWWNELMEWACILDWWNELMEWADGMSLYIELVEWADGMSLYIGLMEWADGMSLHIGLVEWAVYIYIHSTIHVPHLSNPYLSSLYICRNGSCITNGWIFSNPVLSHNTLAKLILRISFNCSENYRVLFLKYTFLWFVDSLVIIFVFRLRGF